MTIMGTTRRAIHLSPELKERLLKQKPENEKDYKYINDVIELGIAAYEKKKVK